MAALTPLVASRACPSLSTLSAASAGGDSMPAGSSAFFRVKTGGTACTVTVNPPAGGSALGLTNAPFALPALAATDERIFGPFPQTPFGDNSGNVNFTYSATTSVTVQALVMSN